MKLVGPALVAVGLVALVWTAVAWGWRDPVTGLYAVYEQRRLADRYEELVRASSGLQALNVREAGRRSRLRAQPGDPIGRLHVERLGLDMVVVEGTDPSSLRAGPGHDRRSHFPGEGRLVYLAGHRTTFLAPFARIDDLRRGDRIELEMPYGTFSYEVTGSRIVAADDLSVLEPTRAETLRLQACHPRFFSSRRYIVSARLSTVSPPPLGAQAPAAEMPPAGIEPAHAV